MDRRSEEQPQERRERADRRQNANPDYAHEERRKRERRARH
ncbi:hypothetical protein [Sphingomonas sp. UNC305MFCol5.2]|nr:hypothetical protein [Sphingomonas sp. UNC305MFCol5.2]